MPEWKNNGRVRKNGDEGNKIPQVPPEGEKEELTAKIGTIDRMAGVEIVINDCIYNLSPGVRFYTNSKMDTYANRSWFKVGSRVGFHLDDRREVIAMWFKSK